MTSPKPTLGRCPICKSPAEAATRPFCSKKCSDVDLNRWLSESYVIADGTDDADENGDDARVRGAAQTKSDESRH